MQDPTLLHQVNLFAGLRPDGSLSSTRPGRPLTIAVIKLGRPGEACLFDLDHCKGCGLCIAECPSGAIQMVP